MKKSLFWIFAAMLGVSLVAGGLQSAWAQEDAFTLEEIKVTAQKREQLVQDVPIAMTVTDAEQMDRQKVYTLQDLARTTPGLEFGHPGNSPGGGASIRGLGTSAFDSQQEPAVGVVVDGVPLGTADAGNLFDVERVEVLRGPQGTLFGYAASAGVINITTASPELGAFKAKVGADATFEGVLGNKFGRQEIRAMMNLPTSEKTALRLTAHANYMQDLKKNKAPGQDNQDVKNTGIRAKYLYEASDELSITLIGEYKRDKIDGPFLFTFGDIDPDDVLYPYLTGLGIKPGPQNQDVYSTHPLYEDKERYSLSAEIDWVMANHDFVSITSFMKDTKGPESNHIYGVDWDIDVRNLLSIRVWDEKSHMDMYTQELRFSSKADSKLFYLGGVYLNKIERKPDNLGYFHIYPPLGNPPFGPPNFLIPVLFPYPPEPNTASYNVKNFNYAAFADATYDVTEDFSLLGGLRYTVYDYDLRNEDIIEGTPVASTTTFDKGYLTWRAGAQYDINPDAMVYATIARSVKSPVVDPPPVDDPGAEATLIKAEVPTNYELGAKLTAFDRRVAIDLNAFYTAVEDYQGEVCTYGESGNLTCSQTNIDEVVSKGLEIDMFGQPVPGLTINSGYIYNPVEYPSGSIESLVGEQIMNTVKHKFTFAAEYENNLTDNLLGFVGADTVYKSDKRLNTELLESSVYPGHWMTGARIGVRDVGDKWNVYVFGRNLGNEPEVTWRTPASAGDTGSITSLILTPKSFRQIGVSFNMNF
jgi:iron complex outermembrane receptor protein